LDLVILKGKAHGEENARRGYHLEVFNDAREGGTWQGAFLRSEESEARSQK